MWYEADLDAQAWPARRNRALPAGRVKARNRALIFGTVLLCIGSVVDNGHWSVNIPAAIVLAATIGAYFGLYTVALKRRTLRSTS